MPLSSTGPTGAAVVHSSHPTHTHCRLQNWKCRKSTHNTKCFGSSNRTIRKKTLTCSTHTTVFFCFCFFKTIRVCRVRWLAQGRTINRPMESSQWQCGKYSTRRVTLGTCWDIDLVPGWSYRTDRPPQHVQILARIKIAFLFCFFFAQFGRRLCKGHSDTDFFTIRLFAWWTTSVCWVALFSQHFCFCSKDKVKASKFLEFLDPAEPPEPVFKGLISCRF